MCRSVRPLDVVLILPFMWPPWFIQESGNHSSLVAIWRYRGGIGSSVAHPRRLMTRSNLPDRNGTRQRLDTSLCISHRRVFSEDVAEALATQVAANSAWFHRAVTSEACSAVLRTRFDSSPADATIPFTRTLKKMKNEYRVVGLGSAPRCDLSRYCLGIVCS